MTVGIYKIENIKNGKVYIGSSKNIESRWTTHMRLLKSKSHHSPKLQNSWDKYGQKFFTFSILEECDMELLDVLEQKWMDLYRSYETGYNCTLTVAGRKPGLPSKLMVDCSVSLDKIVRNIKDFKDEVYHSSANKLLFSFHGMNLGQCSTTARFVKRLEKATNIMVDVSRTVRTLDSTLSYKLHYINYIGKGSFKITPVDRPSSVHDTFKEQNLLVRLLEDITLSFQGRAGESFLYFFRENGIVLNNNYEENF